jgi:hypothetical protein
VTGLPGAGKSLGAVARMLEWRQSDASRPVFVLGVDGLKDGVAQEITADDLERWWEYPAGSIFVVDEAQKYFPMRRAGDAPAWIRKLSEHRHLGHDFLLMTQAPGYLDTYVRGLIDRHTHLVRKFGTHMVDRYDWPSVCMSPLSSAERKRATKSLWRYPKKCFELYHSAEVHTVKARIPKKLFVIAAAIIALPLVIIGVPRIMKHGEKAATPTPLLSSAATAVDGDSKHMTVAEYVNAQIPRIANQPWSAPIFDGQQVKAEPDLLCIEYESRREPGTMLCTCYTEQITPYKIGSLAECRTYARHGVYNPRRPPFEDRQRDERALAGAGSSDGHESAGTAAAAAGPAPGGGRWPEQSSAIHTGYTPPESVIAGGR